MSQWKLVEAEVVTDHGPESNHSNHATSNDWRQSNSHHSNNVQHGHNGGNSYGGRRHGGYNNNNRRNNNHNNNRGGYRRGGGYNRGYNNGIYVPDTPETRAYYVNLTIQAIEMQYSADNLCQDPYFRSYMDEDGYIPLPFIFSFPHIGSIGADYYKVLEALGQHEKFEINADNETVRLRENWKVWLMPNGTGGMGVPRYVKEAPSNEIYAQPEEMEPNVVINDIDNEVIGNRARSGSGMVELSASAAVYTPSSPCK